MKLIVFGATGKTGMEVVKQALAGGHEVTAFVRDSAKMPLENDRLHLKVGDVFDSAAVAEAIQGQNTVVCSLGTSSLGKTTIRSTGTANIIKAMQENDVKRLLVVSAMGIGDSWSTLSTSNKLIFNTLLRSSRKDHEEQEALVMDSGLDWIIVRPSGLTDTAVTGSYDVGQGIMAKTSRIPRADVAHFIVREMDDNAFVGKAVTITN